VCGGVVWKKKGGARWIEGAVLAGLAQCYLLRRINRRVVFSSRQQEQTRAAQVLSRVCCGSSSGMTGGNWESCGAQNREGRQSVGGKVGWFSLFGFLFCW